MFGLETQELNVQNTSILFSNIIIKFEHSNCKNHKPFEERRGENA
jgi:hypothetical protein